jgi:hypothetical protein
MVVNGDGEHLLGALLANDILVENFLDLVRLGELVAGALGAVLELLADDVITQLDTFVTDEYGWAGNQLPNFVLTFPAEGAVQKFSVVVAAAGIFTHRKSS